MPVNSPFVAPFTNKTIVRFGFCILLITAFLVGASFRKYSDPKLKSKQVNIIIRQIGHRLLLQAGDSTSRVMPVTQKQGTFLLKFEKEFVFSHDSLMVLSQQLLPKAQFPSGYTVTVHDCRQADIVYGFQLNNATPDILNCSGRAQPKGCYTIEFTFPDFYDAEEKTNIINPLAVPVKDDRKVVAKPSEINMKGFDSDAIPSLEDNATKANTATEESTTASSVVIFAGILALLGMGLVIFRSRKKVKPLALQDENHTANNQSAPHFPPLGKFLFDAKGQRLLLDSEVFPLTDKECKVLTLLNDSFGELIPRDTLLQEVWINEGVITGRSLDMFVSKLRKKLSADPQLRITNVHGKGYKLESFT